MFTEAVIGYTPASKPDARSMTTGGLTSKLRDLVSKPYLVVLDEIEQLDVGAERVSQSSQG